MVEEIQNETFTFLGITFDVAKAQKIVHDRPREPVMMDMNELAKMLSTRREEGGHIWTSLGIWHDRAYAAKLTEADCRRPGIMVRLKEDLGHLLIDGWHRVAAGQRLGIQEFPVYILTRDEAYDVTIRGTEFLYGYDDIMSKFGW